MWLAEREDTPQSVWCAFASADRAWEPRKWVYERKKEMKYRYEQNKAKGERVLEDNDMK
jgi:hypothetical protein